ERRPAPRERAEVDEIERGAVAVRQQKFLDRLRIKLRLQRLQPRDGEDRIVQILVSIAIEPAAAATELTSQKRAHQFGAVAQQARSQPRHLQHFEAKAQGVRSDFSAAASLRNRSSCSWKTFSIMR